MTVYLLESGLRNYEYALAELGAAVSYTEPDDCSALLLQGGGDVCPALYGREDRGSVFTDPERDRRETSQTISVDFSSIWSSRNSRLGLCLSPCSRSVMISSAPAAFSSLVCR